MLAEVKALQLQLAPKASAYNACEAAKAKIEDVVCNATQCVSIAIPRAEKRPWRRFLNLLGEFPHHAQERRKLSPCIQRLESVAAASLSLLKRVVGGVRSGK